MASLTELRDQLDAVDDQIVRLFENGWICAVRWENIRYRMQKSI